MSLSARPARLILGAWLAVAAAAGPALANTFSVFGPQSYQRGSGAPATVQSAFQVLNPASPYRLRIRTDRVASAVISLNGVTVVDPSRFNENVTTLEVPITVQATNDIAVQVRGGPGGVIVLEIIGIDNDPPLITATAAPGPNPNGWNNSTVVVTFVCTDSISGIATCPAPIPVSAEGQNQTVSGTAVDKAGNTATASVTVSVDRTPPTVRAAQAPASNVNGWNNSPVSVHFNCGDTGSGVSECPADRVIDTEGSNQIVSGTARDYAGNTATGQATLSIDRTPPVFTFTSPAAESTVSTSNVVVRGMVSDGLSGVAVVTCNGTPVSISDVQCPVTLNPGVNVISATATDKAGNTITASMSLTFTPPRLAPKVTITSPSNFSYLNLTPTTVTGTIDDSTASVTVNAIPVPVANGVFTLALPLAEGPNTITASAIAANNSVGAASVLVTLDTTPPHVTITLPADGFTTTDARISVAGNVNDIVVGTINDQQAQVTVNGAGAQIANRLFLAADVPLTVGPNVIQAVATDRVGNAATTQITVTRQIPAAKPSIQAISGNNQVGVIGAVLAAPLVVVLTDSSGTPVANKPVIFKVTQNDGVVTGGGTSGPTAIVATDGQGRARAQWTLGMRAGAGGNTVEAYAVGFGGTAMFNATGALGQPSKIVIDTGNNQIGSTGQPLPKPFIAVVVDAGNNRLSDVPVTFTVKQGGGTIDGLTAVSMNTDSDGRVAAVLTLGLQEGNANNLVEASFASNQTFPAAFTASGRVAGDPAKTTISGVVLDNSDHPIPGVTLRVVLTDVLNANANAVQQVPSVQTDAQGQFVIPGAPVGLVKLLADGSTAQLPGPFPSLEYDLITVAGQNNTVGQPIYLLPLSTANQICLTDTVGGGTLTIPDAPGFSLALTAGQVTFPGGSKTGCVSVTVVHRDKVPMVPGFGQQPRFIVTIQPSGAVFNPPAAITLPNVDGLKPRAVTEMYSFDHDIGSFVAIGTGVVSDDGLLIRSSPGVGVLKAGWHCGGDPSETGSAATCPTCQECAGSECVPSAGGSCDDGHFCTENDTCSDGVCAGTPIEDQPGSTTTFAINLDAAFDPIKNVLKTMFGSGAPDFSLQIAGSVGTVDQCCETKKSILSNKTASLSGEAGISADIPIPGLAVTLPFGLQAGFFATFGGSVSGTVSATEDQCDDSVSGSLEATLALTVGIKGQVTLPADVASASVGGTTGVNCGVTGSASSGSDVIDASATCGHNGVVLTATAQLLNGIIEVSSNIVVIEPASLPPLEFTVPIPF